MLTIDLLNDLVLRVGLRSPQQQCDRLVQLCEESMFGYRWRGVMHGFRYHTKYAQYYGWDPVTRRRLTANPWGHKKMRVPNRHYYFSLQLILYPEFRHLNAEDFWPVVQWLCPGTPKCRWYFHRRRDSVRGRSVMFAAPDTVDVNGRNGHLYQELQRRGYPSVSRPLANGTYRPWDLCYPPAAAYILRLAEFFALLTEDELPNLPVLCGDCEATPPSVVVEEMSAAAVA